MVAYLSERGGASQVVNAIYEPESEQTGFSGQLASAYPVLDS